MNFVANDRYKNAFVIHTDEPFIYLHFFFFIMSFSASKRKTERDASSGSSQSKVRRVTNDIEDSISPNVKQYIDLNDIQIWQMLFFLLWNNLTAFRYFNGLARTV